MYIFEATYYNDEAGGEERKSTIRVIVDRASKVPESNVYLTAMSMAYDGKKEDEELTMLELIGC